MNMGIKISHFFSVSFVKQSLTFGSSDYSSKMNKQFSYLCFSFFQLYNIILAVPLLRYTSHLPFLFLSGEETDNPLLTVFLFLIPMTSHQQNKFARNKLVPN